MQIESLGDGDFNMVWLVRYHPIYTDRMMIHRRPGAGDGEPNAIGLPKWFEMA